MERRRVKDGLVGAAIGVLVVVLVAVLFVLWVTEPAGTRDSATGPPDATSLDRPPSVPPANLAVGEMWLTDLVLEAGTLATRDGAIHDVEAFGTDMRTGPGGLVAGSLKVDATVPFALVAAQIADDVVVQAAGSQAEVVRVFTFAGRDLRVVATGTVEVVAGRLVIEPQSIDVGGSAFLADLIGAAARELVTIEHEIEGLPEGLVLRDVTVQEDGFRAELRGEDVSLAAGGAGLLP